MNQPRNLLEICFKGVRANCLCASLLRTQLMSQRHATSCTSARAKEEIYSPEGMVSVALTLLRINSLGWSVLAVFTSRCIARKCSRSFGVVSSVNAVNCKHVCTKKKEK